MDMKGVFGRSNHILNDRVVQKQSLMVFAANPKGLVLYLAMLKVFLMPEENSQGQFSGSNLLTSVE